MKVKLSELKFSDLLTGLRSVDAFTVSRYRIAMRAGAEFPKCKINRETMEIVSGNHRVTAMLAEYGEDRAIDVLAESYKDDAAMIREFAADNVANGRPMDGWTMRKIAIALADAGESLDKIAVLLNVPVAHLQKWGGKTVVVIGKDNKRHTEPIKSGVTVPKGTMTERQYQRHADNDVGMTLTDLADQVSERLENGWVNAEDEKETAALDRLRAALR